MNRWRIIGGVAVALSLALLGDQMLYVVLPGRPEAAGIGVAALGVVLGVNRFIRLGANSLAGILADRLGRRPLFLAGMAGPCPSSGARATAAPRASACAQRCGPIATYRRSSSTTAPGRAPSRPAMPLAAGRRP